MNLVDVKISRFDHGRTRWDRDHREPKGRKKYLDPVTVRSQVSYRKTEMRNNRRTGDKEFSEGHLVFRSSDLEKWGMEFKKGDKVVEIAGRKVDYAITEVRPTAILGGRANTTTMFFERGV